MRVPKAVNPRKRLQLLKKFGIYEKVLPVETTPSRVVPDTIERPDYLARGKQLTLPCLPEIKDDNQLKGMRTSCKLASTILSQVQNFIKPGVTTDDIDQLVHSLIIKAGAYPSPLHYKGFPKSICTSVNNVAVHGIPDLRPLSDGDIVNVDITVFLHGFHGDCSKTFKVGNVDDRGLQLVEITEQCLGIGIGTCGPGVPFSEIGASIQRHARRNGLTVIPSIVGHGIGQYFHGPPDIYHIRNRYPGVMKAGMTFTIEPVVSHGTQNTVLLDDGWTILTEDGSRTSQIEHTVLITDDGVEILTK
ncbi:methionine aminopeptidase 1D, mitochondrial isoform X2 [Bombyx mori]|uniref:Methionine aminopeptidase n=1 Tax=Bombyx mori TaxID=7091 RepID=A0A8R2LVA2_BOMMO|nr:methionine aminopeptidase 1D, mitochondrial isoform X2 [Bombyx mori]XP_037866938.1 methionine aminopeptidase 1D, mitochondrial isoform X2 [Bombyx mori]XP_037866939.1 methionine aminopeptidase 1D, mitochondrial isoform X2 [Bombyx mori]XP_037866940.1 methionine aminopeptidase 1D, mitochondrial isoform X2 [Bombyx mori]XP_037866941.1 methionine aminopeptidase 1D, mitochondrial isoform X2 [Bombyx mori]